MFRRLAVLLTIGVSLSSCTLSGGSTSRHLLFMEAISTPMPATSPPPLESVPTPAFFPDAFAAARALGRGINIGNALEAPTEGEWGVTIKEEYFDLIKEAGFNAVRLPMRWSGHAQTQAPYTIEARFFARVDEVIGWAFERGLVVVLNVHHYGEMAVNPEDHEQRFLALWKQIAGHYKDYPRTLFFEPLNEPNSAMTAPIWNKFLNQALAAIRKSNPERIVMIGGVSWNAYDQLQYLELPADDHHIVASYHYYNPFQFTHQGADWVDGSAPWLGTTWDAADAQKAEVSSHFDMVAAWAKKHNLPVYMGEFGAYATADMASRLYWTSFVAREAEARGFAWAYWEFCSGFGAYDPDLNAWRSPLLKALIP
jgi:endoglucanase